MNLVSRSRFRRHLLLAWLVAGVLLLLGLPVAPHTAQLGWSGLYWLLGAPLALLVLLAREPQPALQAVRRRS